MKITGTQKYNINFKSGLTNKILAKEKFIDSKTREKIFEKYYEIEACFKENKSAALANSICLKILGDLSSKLNVKLKFPPAVFVYNKDQLINKEDSLNFCIPDTQYVLKDDYPFPGRSIFLKNFNNLEEINNISEALYNKNESSTSHFLAPFMHEWLHSFQLDLIYQTHGYGGECFYLQEIYPIQNTKISGYKLLEQLETKSLSARENEIVRNTIGNYSTKPINQYLEIFSETLTKFICASLKDTSLIRNPLDELKKTSKDFQDIFYKVCKFK